MKFRYRCQYTEVKTRTVICRVCGQEYSYPYKGNGPDVKRDTCDECCSRDALKHRQHYTDAIKEGVYLTSDTSAVLLASCLEGRNPMTFEEVAEMTGKDARDWRAFHAYLVQCGEWSRLVRMIRNADRQQRTARELDFMSVAL